MQNVVHGFQIGKMCHCIFQIIINVQVKKYICKARFSYMGTQLILCCARVRVCECVCAHAHMHVFKHYLVYMCVDVLALSYIW